MDAARGSYGENPPQSERSSAEFIDYLLGCQPVPHIGPFQFGIMQIAMKIPIFVLRQWFRHARVAFAEMSARHTKVTDVYVPHESRYCFGHKTDKQMSGKQMPEDDVIYLQGHFAGAVGDAEDLYEFLVTRQGMAKEVARTILPVGSYTTCTEIKNLRDIMFLCLARLDKHAQPEIQEYASVLWGAVRTWFPEAAAAFENHFMGAVKLSAKMLTVIKWYHDGPTVPTPTLVPAYSHGFLNPHMGEFGQNVKWIPGQSPEEYARWYKFQEILQAYQIQHNHTFRQHEKVIMARVLGVAKLRKDVARLLKPYGLTPTFEWIRGGSTGGSNDSA